METNSILNLRNTQRVFIWTASANSPEQLYILTWGTGRYANATGAGTMVLADDLDTEIISVPMDACVTH